MKIIYWLGIAFLWMLPLNFLLLTAAKLLSADPLGSEELVGLGTAVFGGAAGGSCIAVVLTSAQLRRASMIRCSGQRRLKPCGIQVATNNDSRGMGLEKGTVAPSAPVHCHCGPDRRYLSFNVWIHRRWRLDRKANRIRTARCYRDL